MPRAAKGSPEAKAWAEKMKAKRDAKLRATEENGESQNTEPVETSPEPTYDNGADVEALRQHVMELEQFIRTRLAAPPVQTGPQVTSGGIRGTLTKYSVNPKDYPNPTDRLFGERPLTIQGFNRDWWDIEWEVSRVNYETKEGVHITEPKFQVKIIRIVPDEEGMPSAKRYVLHKATFFEDPDAAMQIAHDLGVDVPEEIEKAFLDEMRYLRIRDWVKESFYPPKPTQAKMNKQETVIGNRLVEVYEINSHNSETIPFEQLNKKL